MNLNYSLTSILILMSCSQPNVAMEDAPVVESSASQTGDSPVSDAQMELYILNPSFQSNYLANALTKIHNYQDPEILKLRIKLERTSKSLLNRAEYIKHSYQKAIDADTLSDSKMQQLIKTSSMWNNDFEKFNADFEKLIDLIHELQVNENAY